MVGDRYVASSIAYGVAQGLDADWLSDIQRFLPCPELTILLDIDPALAAERKTAGRDRYERDLVLLKRVRDSYLDQAESSDWICADGNRSKDDVACEIMSVVTARLSQA